MTNLAFGILDSGGYFRHADGLDGTLGQRLGLYEVAERAPECSPSMTQRRGECGIGKNDRDAAKHAVFNCRHAAPPKSVDQQDLYRHKHCPVVPFGTAISDLSDYNEPGLCCSAQG